MDTGPGLRARKKARTRRLIAETALALFAEHGFDGVTVAEVARRADVSQATVFNYFPTKEDLVYSELEVFEATLLGAVRDRGPGIPVAEVFRRLVVEPRGLLAVDAPEAATRFATIARVIAASPALKARERQAFDRWTRSLAQVLAEEAGAPPDDVQAWVVANALMGVHRALVEYVRGQVLAGRHGPSLARAVRAEGERALAALERGLAGE
jgi:AcrR family transcriptional regulator